MHQAQARSWYKSALWGQVEGTVSDKGEVRVYKAGLLEYLIGTLLENIEADSPAAATAWRVHRDAVWKSRGVVVTRG